MDLKVLWTDTAKFQLKDIFDYYRLKVSNDFAITLVTRIVDKTEVLEKSPLVGQVEELLRERKLEYRYLVEGNYKIIYWVEEEFVKIAAVFDCRQNPVKMEKI